MNDLQNPITNIKSSDDFIAHALALEEETYKSYRDLAETLAAHHNSVAASRFFVTAKQIKHDCKELKQLFEERALTEPPPWEYGWASNNDLHTRLHEAHYLMNEQEAIELIIGVQRSELNFYHDVVIQRKLDSLTPYAERVIEQGNKRIHEWNSQLAELGETKKCLDLDPPNIPE